jgi:formylmethanofuran dehydrogenase subunit E
VSSKIPNTQSEISRNATRRERNAKRRKHSAPVTIDDGNTRWSPNSDDDILCSEESRQMVVSEMNISDTLYHNTSNTFQIQRNEEHVETGGASRGRYKCQRCGELETNHRCEYYEDRIMCSIATQIVNTPIINWRSNQPREGERILMSNIDDKSFERLYW